MVKPAISVHAGGPGAFVRVTPPQRRARPAGANPAERLAFSVDERGPAGWTKGVQIRVSHSRFNSSLFT